MNLFQLISKQMRQRSLSTWLTLLSVLLGVGLATSILMLRREGRSLFGQSDYGADVVVGATVVVVGATVVVVVGSVCSTCDVGVSDGVGANVPVPSGVVEIVIDGSPGMLVGGASGPLVGVIAAGTSSVADAGTV